VENDFLLNKQQLHIFNMGRMVEVRAGAVLKRREGARPHVKSLGLLRAPMARSVPYDAGTLLELDVIKTALVYTCTMFYD